MGQGRGMSVSLWDGVPASSGCSQTPPHPSARGGHALIGPAAPHAPAGVWVGPTISQSLPVAGGRGRSLVSLSPASVMCDERGRSQQGAGLGEVGVMVPRAPGRL